MVLLLAQMNLSVMKEVTSTPYERHIHSNVSLACRVSSAEKEIWDWIKMYPEALSTKIAPPQYIWSVGVFPFEDVKRPFAEQMKWSSDTHCPGNKMFPFSAFSLSGTSFHREDFVGRQWALPYSHAAHLGCSKFPAEEK